MSETFYTALDVARDASREAITSAYREKVKTHHPDVSDDPASPRTFRRITAARDILLDEDERERYDRLGHDVYVRRHLDTDAWEAASTSADPSTAGSDEGSAAQGRAGATNAHRRSGPTASGGRATGSATDRPGHGNSARSARSRAGDRRSEAASNPAGAASGAVGESGGAERRWGWLGEDWDPSTREARERDRRRREQRYRSYHGDDGDWQQASPMYTSRPTGDTGRRGSRNDDLLKALRRVGPWLGVHVIFVSSAIATGLFTFTEAGAVFELSLVQYAVAAVLLSLLVLTSVLHLVSVLYAG